ncbi:hypothetical protein V1477_019972 [Vespula maculifrons]|uniref:Uncharacterized protein n=1 Tax=Vespula maculifrons TaxID=7453 RepID=A0ABD2AKM2_VESMC
MKHVHERVKKMKLKRKDVRRTSLHPAKTKVQKSSWSTQPFARQYLHTIRFDETQVLPTQVPPRGGCCRPLFAPENTTSVPANADVNVLSNLPVSRADISKFAKKRKRRREREEKEKKMRTEESQNVRTREEDGAEKKRKKRISIGCNGTHARVKTMKLK